MTRFRTSLLPTTTCQTGYGNLGNGQFEEVGFSTGCDRDLTGEAKAGMGVSVEDIDNDGDQINRVQLGWRNRLFLPQ